MPLSLPSLVTLLSIELENFRNFQRLHLPLDTRGGILEAPNGRGKTNLLEAIHYLTLFRSFRGAPDAELVHFGERGFCVRGLLAEGGGPPRAVGVGVEGRRKRLSLDGRPARAADHLGAALSVILSPADIGLVQGSPSCRRRYLDVVLALSSRPYLRSLRDYGRVLKQRNRLLQVGGAAAHAGLLEPWTEQLVRHAGAILEARLGFLRRWGARFAEISARIAGSPAGALAWRYERAGAVAGGARILRSEVEDSLRLELERRAQLERRRGMTLAGPHRDDLVIHPQGELHEVHDLRRFGSQGEQRTAALALRFLESEVLAHERGQLPIVLLDDVFSELDPQRSRELLSFLAPRQQVFLTTPKPLVVRLPLELPRYTMVAGLVRAA